MSKKILDALMRLFAIIASHEHVSADRRNVVQLFLKQQFSQEIVDEYITVFDNYLEGLCRPAASSTKVRKRTAVQSVKVLRICMQINTELTQTRKIVVLVRLIEFINKGETIIQQELDFVKTVSDTFNITQEEFEQCMAFVKSGKENIPYSGNLLLIDGDDSRDYQNTHHICAEGLAGQLRVLRVASVNMYFLKFFGGEDVYLNGQLLLKDQVYILNTGSAIRSSRINPVYYSDIEGCYLQDTIETKFTFSVDNVTYKFKSGEQGLHELCIHEASGKLIGCMGASGAGKSTLLNILNGSYKPSSGNISINDFDVHRHKEHIQGVIGYISQDDLLMEDLTVFQNLYYNAKLCFEGYSEYRINRKVVETLKSLGLYHIKDMKVGSPLNKKISGGQRKRLNIALELIRQPHILFVDEPTSGLSSRDSENIMDLLKALSLKGKLLFVVIHQPSSEIFKLFDKLLILDTGGFPTYYGNPLDAISYFKSRIQDAASESVECNECGNVSPEQIFNTIESSVLDEETGRPTGNRRISPKEWNKKYSAIHGKKSSTKQSKKEKIPASFKKPGKLKQFAVFIKRDLLSKYANTQYMAINFLEAPLLAVILALLVKFYESDSSGYIFRENDNIPAYLFMCVVIALFMGLTVSAEEIIKDQKLLKRESFLNLSKGSYLLSKVAIMFILSAIQALSLILLGNLILEIKGMYLDYFLVIFSTFCFANMLGLNISSGLNSAVTIYILIPFLLIPQLMLSGVIVKFDRLHPDLVTQGSVPFIGEMMTSKWAYEALAVHQFKQNKFYKNLYEIDKIRSTADFKKNFWVPKFKDKVNDLLRQIDHPELHETMVNNLEILKREISEESRVHTSFPPGITDSMDVRFFNPGIANKVKLYAEMTKRHYIKISANAFNEHDNLIATMKDGLGEQAFQKLKDDYTNDGLNDLLKNKNDVSKITEADGRLVQRYEPIFLDPENAGLFGTHFFSPRKKVFGNYIDTYWANIMVIWMMTLLLALTLYFDLLRKLITETSELSRKFKRS